MLDSLLFSIMLGNLLNFMSKLTRIIIIEEARLLTCEIALLD